MKISNERMLLCSQEPSVAIVATSGRPRRVRTAMLRHPRRYIRVVGVICPIALDRALPTFFFWAASAPPRRLATSDSEPPLGLSSGQRCTSNGLLDHVGVGLASITAALINNKIPTARIVTVNSKGSPCPSSLRV